MPVDALLARLDHCKPAGRDHWMARCPAHPDTDPSLSITLNTDGRVLIHCFAGCGAVDVVDAVGLSLSDLFPEGPLGHKFKPLARDLTQKPLDAMRLSRRINEVVDDFKKTGRVRDQGIVLAWARNFVDVMRCDAQAGQKPGADDVALLQRAMSVIGNVRSQA